MTKHALWGMGGAVAAVLGTALYLGAPGMEPGTEGTAGAAQELATRPGTATRAPSSGLSEAQPAKPARSEGSAVEVEIDGIDGIIRATGLDEAFSIEEQGGRRGPQGTTTVIKAPDGYTNSLLRLLTRGTSVKVVTIRKMSGRSSVPEFTLRLTNVVVEAVRSRWDGVDESEAVTFRFGAIRRDVPDGGRDFEFDFRAMKG